jgi:hypothetical protein
MEPRTAKEANPATALAQTKKDWAGAGKALQEWT